MKKPPGLTIDVNSVNVSHEKSRRLINTSSGSRDTKKPTSTAAASPSCTFREEGLSIGRDFMRMEGITICSKQSIPSMADLIVLQTLGRGVSSLVQLAKRKRGIMTKTNRSISDEFLLGDEDSSGSGIGDATKTEDEKEIYYALKIFPLLKEANQARIVPTSYSSSNNNNEQHSSIDRDNTTCLHFKKYSSMLTQEIKTLSRIQCDSIIQFKGAFYDPSNYNVTMILEYMDYGSLHDYLHLHCYNQEQQDNLQIQQPMRKRVVLTEDALASISYQTLYGLSYLHYEEILHRDIKPQNILINSRGEIKISDLGISSCKKLFQRTGDGDNVNENDISGLNHTVIGTSWYMSPERVLDKAYGCSSDLWSFGLVLMECATGGLNPMRDVDFIDDQFQSDIENNGYEGRKIQKRNTTSMIELAITLEDFCIHQTFEKLDNICCYQRNNHIFDCAIDWKEELTKKSGFGELIIVTLQKTPGKRMLLYLYSQKYDTIFLNLE